MKIFGKYHTQKGLTIIEVLAALVILGIVFISIMSIFPQMTLFNEKTESKLDTMNLARQEMAYFTGIEQTYAQGFPITEAKLKTFIELKLSSRFTDAPLEKEPFTDEYLNYEFEKDGVLYQYQILKSPDLGDGETTLTTLYKVILSVKVISSTPVSQTYGYLEINK